MGFNYGYGRKKMEEEFAKIAKLCRKEGMPEEKIEEIHDMMLEDLNKDRAFRVHTQPLDGLRFPDGDEAEEGRSPLLDKFLGRLSVTQGEIYEWGRMDWIEDLDTVEIIVWVKEQSEKDIELLTLLSVDGLKQKEVAGMWNVSPTAISKKMKKIRESLAKVLPEWLKTSCGI